MIKANIVANEMNTVKAINAYNVMQYVSKYGKVNKKKVIIFFIYQHVHCKANKQILYLNYVLLLKNVNKRVMFIIDILSTIN